MEGGGREAGRFSVARSQNPPAPPRCAAARAPCGSCVGFPAKRRARGERLEVRMINEAGAAPRAEEADGAMINLNELLSTVAGIHCEPGARERQAGGDERGRRRGNVWSSWRGAAP